VVPILDSDLATRYRGQNGDVFAFSCSPQTQIGPIWGTGIYTDDSVLCTAAIHFGATTQETGGVLAIQIMPGQSAYYGSTQNGITSSSYGTFGGSYQMLSCEALGTTGIIPQTTGTTDSQTVATTGTTGAQPILTTATTSPQTTATTAPQTSATTSPQTTATTATTSPQTTATTATTSPQTSATTAPQTTASQTTTSPQTSATTASQTIATTATTDSQTSVNYATSATSGTILTTASTATTATTGTTAIPPLSTAAGTTTGNTATNATSESNSASTTAGPTPNNTVEWTTIIEAAGGIVGGIILISILSIVIRRCRTKPQTPSKKTHRKSTKKKKVTLREPLEEVPFLESQEEDEDSLA
jgi:hypothetical protein